MGRILALVLEYDGSRRRPFTGAIDGVVDYTKSLDVLRSPDPVFRRVLEGAAARGFPATMNHLVEEYFGEHFGADHAECGWLAYRELAANLRSAGARPEKLKPPLRRVVACLRDLAREYGEERARLVFAIGRL